MGGAFVGWISLLIVCCLGDCTEYLSLVEDIASAWCLVFESGVGAVPLSVAAMLWCHMVVVIAVLVLGWCSLRPPSLHCCVPP